MKTPKELCGAELTEGAAAGGTCPQCGYVSASAAFCPNDGRRLLDHEFVWRADALDCSVCGQPHSGCDIVYGNPEPKDVRRDDAEASISPQEAYDSLLALIEEAGSNNHLDDVDCSNLVFYAEVLKPRASTRPEQQSAGESRR